VLTILRGWILVVFGDLTDLAGFDDILDYPPHVGPIPTELESV
jgi:hypothetical protein